MLGFIRAGPRGLLDQPGGRRLGHPVPDRRERRDGPARGRLVGPGGRHDLRLVRRADQLHHGRRLPRRPGGVRALVAGRPPRHRQGHRPLPHDLLAGDAVERRARGAAEGLGPRLAARCRRRADEQEPRQLPRPGRRRGRVRGRRRPLRHAARGRRSTATPRCRGTRSSGATTPTSRTTSATSSTGPSRWPTATSTASGRRLADAGPLPSAWPSELDGLTRGRRAAASSTRRWRELWEFVGAANRLVDAEKPWELAKAAKAGDAEAGGAAARRPRRPRRGLPAGRGSRPRRSCRRPRRACSRSSATRIRTRADGNGGPPLLDELRWGAHAGEPGRLGAAGAAVPAPRSRKPTAD